MAQVRSPHATTKSPHAATKSPYATTKTQCSQNKQMNKYFLKKSRSRLFTHKRRSPKWVS